MFNEVTMTLTLGQNNESVHLSDKSCSSAPDISPPQDLLFLRYSNLSHHTFQGNCSHTSCTQAKKKVHHCDLWPLKQFQFILESKWTSVLNLKKFRANVPDQKCSTQWTHGKSERGLISRVFNVYHVNLFVILHTNWNRNRLIDIQTVNGCSVVNLSKSCFVLCLITMVNQFSEFIVVQHKLQS